MERVQRDSAAVGSLQIDTGLKGDSATETEAGTAHRETIFRGGIQVGPKEGGIPSQRGHLMRPKSGSWVQALDRAESQGEAANGMRPSYSR